MSSNTYLLIPRMKIICANASSTAYTIGFPAMTAWMGAMHAMERYVQSKEGFENIFLSRLAIIHHKFYLRVFKENKKTKIIGEKRPMIKDGSTFKPAPFIEEPKCDLVVSMLIGVDGLESSQKTEFEKIIREKVVTMRFAGGDAFITDYLLDNIKAYEIENNNEKDIRPIRNKIKSGFALIGRPDLITREDGKDSLDSMLDIIQQKNKTGWYVPIAIGFKDLVGAIETEGQRSYQYEHHFVEPISIIGEFVMPYKFNDIEDMMWHYEYDKSNGLYYCQN